MAIERGSGTAKLDEGRVIRRFPQITKIEAAVGDRCTAAGGSRKGAKP